MDTDQSSTFLSSIQSEIAKYQLLIEEENQKLKRYKVGARPALHSHLHEVTCCHNVIDINSRKWTDLKKIWIGSSGYSENDFFFSC